MGSTIVKQDGEVLFVLRNLSAECPPHSSFHSQSVTDEAEKLTLL